LSDYVWGNNKTQFFYDLRPEVILDAIDLLGLKTTGRCLPLNSMENRVYEIEVDRPDSEIGSESDKFVVAKFYRPGRWTKEQILEEHQFLLDLKEAEIPVIAPMVFEGETLFELKEQNLFYTLFPRKGGRVPQEMNTEQLQIMGRLLARIHNIGAIKNSNHRIKISPVSFGEMNLNFLLEGKFLPPHLESSYKEVITSICNSSLPLFEGIKSHRIHGDCHWGNIIWREEEGPFFIDFDDMLVGPAIQDIWLVVPGTDHYGIEDRRVLIEAYDSMRSFDHRELKLVEPLRALRFIHFAAWTAKRWEDPSFKKAFVNFGTEGHWQGLLNDLKYQLALIQNSSTPDSNPYQY
jgi:Ser/Thr protein kinase RdoA (MazF antagonist)